MRNRYLVLGAETALAAGLRGGNARARWLSAAAAAGAWYFGGEGGWTTLDNEGGRFNVGGLAHRQSFHDGFNIGARAGYEWGPWRLEEEFRFQQNGQNRFGIGPVNLKATGNRNAHAIMSNLIYDFNIGWALTPHIGGGIGAVALHDAVGIPRVRNIVRSTDWEFGYQGIAGVRYNINPSLAFDVDYRYLATTTPTFRTVFGGIRYTSGYDSHNVVASLSLRFGPPPPVVVPPVPPAPPPMARKVFLVFFDWDRDTITPEGMQIIQQAAAAYRGGAPIPFQVNGYTDLARS